jgi:isoquinoline 1-oxidoreductase beta subunit
VIGRRAFLQVSATAAGGLVVGFVVGCRGKKKAPATQAEGAPAAPVSGDGADLNAYIRIDPDDTVTMRIPESEMGQGILTGLSMILAEALDADWAKVRAEHAPADAKAFGRQSTGGSTSTRKGWETLEQAGLTARALLVGAAAEAWGVAAGECATEPGVVVHAASGRRARYGELAARAAKQPVPREPPRADPAKRGRIVGKPTRRLDARAKVTGEAVYGLDVRVPGLLVAQVAKPPTIGGAVKRVDAAAAKAVPGVRHVVEIPGGVAVVADHMWAAARGREALVVEWHDGPNAGLSSATVSATLAKLAPGGIEVRKDGDPAAALAKAPAAKRLRAAYEVPYLAHAPMEPLNATAHVRADGCEIWTGTQAPSSVVKLAGDITGLPAEKITVHTTFLGGGFGRRSQSDYVGDALHVAKAVGAPVKVVWTREDDTRGGYYRPAALSQLEGAVDAEGWPVAWTQRIACPSILAAMGPLQGGVDGTAVEGVENLPYAVPNVLVTYAKPDLPVSLWFWRSVGSSQNAWSTECFLDELARAGGKDPLEVRRRLLANKPRHLRVLEAAAEMAGWGTAKLADGHALGLAVHESFGSFVAEVAEVSIAPGAPRAPRVHRVWCAVDCGRVVNPDGVVAQMESGIFYGLSAALHGAIRLDQGRVVESNFHDYPVVRITEAPRIEVRLVGGEDPPGGVGEPGTPPIAPAVCNALFALTGKPVRTLPIRLA